MFVQRFFLCCIPVFLAACGGGSTSGSSLAGSDHSSAGSTSVPSKLFVDRTDETGIEFLAGYKTSKGVSDIMKYCGGVASDDVNNDGLVDLFFIKGDIDQPSLYLNNGDNRYREATDNWGIDVEDHKGCGPAFADVNGDDRLDLFIGGIDGDPSYLWLQQQDNQGKWHFIDKTQEYGLADMVSPNTISASFGDYDGDGWLDLFLGHWGTPESAPKEHLWRNLGGKRFENTTVEAGLAEYMILQPNNTAVLGAGVDYSFSGAFSDINNDRCPDLLVIGDFTTSQVFLNRCDGIYQKYASDEIDIDNGMGGTTGDLDNDGDLDWFVSGIATASGQGNRLYLNNHLSSQGAEQMFTDVSQEKGVVDGGWGWGACFADFDNNGLLDIFHVNGWQAGLFGASYADDRSRLYMAEVNAGDNTLYYREQALVAGITDRTQGRGVVCFDSDNDGDVDIITANGIFDEGLTPFKFYQNTHADDHSNASTQLRIQLLGSHPNTAAIGSKIKIVSSQATQMREVTANSNFVSNNPSIQYVGFAPGDTIESIEVRWQDGRISLHQGPFSKAHLTISHPDRNF
ncbi:CRTAC1 family protein [Gilvimarinus sp. 2_MG-2023]|uniref:CRTAC1 family protein n=1 Tax=Gilvimarinus sp. 2_MG-2023 TaxID=3062666 RepID=UPI0026E3CA1E|nr:CRTAC1 family protein [Gilvimarinus sp. 2_MG-2023]MDO6571396.1 CRTAC1 family protein [Gilvimarinus sp. 2_MG-2023]